jgi:PAS domain S-box-containing protein
MTEETLCASGGMPQGPTPEAPRPCGANGEAARKGDTALFVECHSAEDVLRETERRLAHAMRLAQLVDWEYDVAGGYFTFSDRYYALHGTTSEIEGGEVMFAETFARKFVHPDDAHLVGEEIAKAVAADNPAYFTQLEARILRRDGGLRHVLVRISIEKDAAGRTVRLHGANQDITERKKNEEDLQMLWRAAEQSPATVVITNASGDIEYVNPKFCEITGYGVAEALGRNPRILKSGLHSCDFYKKMWETILKGNIWRGELCNKKKSGEFYWESASIAPIRDSRGRTTHFVAIKEDITERRRLHRELLETSRMAGMAEVATSVLHNVGNVLNSVNISSSILADKVRQSRIPNLEKAVALMRTHESNLAAFLTQDPKGRQLMDYLHSLAAHLAAEQAGMLEELASLTKNVEHIKGIVAMQQSYSRVSGVTEIVPPMDLVEDALRMNGASLDRHHIELVREYSETPALRVEKHKVLQILVNLIRNAKHACDESGRTDKRLTARVGPTADNRVRISIIDNGMGIPPENMPRIFSLGFTTRRDGHGFGLHSGVMAAQELGGSLAARSDGAGKGAEFTLELPLQPPGAAAQEPASPAGNGNGRT